MTGAGTKSAPVFLCPRGASTQWSVVSGQWSVNSGQGYALRITQEEGSNGPGILATRPGHRSLDCRAGRADRRALYPAHAGRGAGGGAGVGAGGGHGGWLLWRGGRVRVDVYY